MLDFSLHGEKGKVDGKEQGLTSEQRNGRYERKRDEKCHIAKRKEEYFMSKGAHYAEIEVVLGKRSFSRHLFSPWQSSSKLGSAHLA